MRILWYCLTALFGLIGLWALIRTVEELAIGAGLMPKQLMIAFVMLLFAAVSLQKARAAT